MSEGKRIAQAGHAYVDAILGSLDTEIGRLYASQKPGTKISLAGGSEYDLMDLSDRLNAIGIPTCKIIDKGHIELPDFDGSDVLTAIGVGPIARDDAPKFLKKLKLIGKDKS